MGVGLHHKSCFVPFLGSGTMLVLKGHKIPLLKAGELPGVLIQELLLPGISLGKGYFSPLPGQCQCLLRSLTSICAPSLAVLYTVIRLENRSTMIRYL